MSAKNDLPALTGVRGIAAWWIVLFHFNEYLSPFADARLKQLVGQGYLAVDLFFELSGFIIALNYADRFRVIRLTETFRFLGVRLARIYPLHIVILLLFLLNPLALSLFGRNAAVGHTYELRYFVMSIFLVQNWGFSSFLAWNVPAWSISTEWLAYILFPLIAWISGRLIHRRSHALISMIVLLCVLAAGFALTGVTLGDRIPQTGAFRCVVEFWLGMCLYFLWRREVAKEWLANAAIGLAAAIFAAYAVFDVPDFTLVPLAFLLLIFGLANDRSVLSRIVASRPIKFLGTVSYSTYLIHFFVRDWTKFILVRDGIPPAAPVVAYLTLTAAASVVFYYSVEVPGRYAARAWVMRLTTARPSIPAAGAVRDTVIPAVERAAE